jgi:(p)ppGpp synthase/HD superfamily hydrolase
VYYHVAVVAGVVFFAVRALLALIPGTDRRLSDQEVPVELIIREFGKPVADIVMEVTDDKNLPKEERRHRQSKPR